ncbi:MAG: dihydrolipoamide acetyltransferase family protein [Oryzihumus sp.]
MSSIKRFNLPDPGEGLTEAEIVTWKVKAGDTVKVNDIIVEIETAKSLVELPVPFAGTVSELLVSEGETVEVGTPIIAVETGQGGTAPVQDAPAAGAVEPGIEGSPAPKLAAAAAAAEEQIEEGKIGGTTSTGRTAVLVGYGVKQTEAKRRPRKAGTTPAPAAAPTMTAQAAPAPAPAGVAPAAPARSLGEARALTKPPVRKLAKDLGIDLTQVTPSGEGGIITRADVEAHVAGGSTAVEAAPAAAAPAYQAPVFARSGERETRVPIKGVRKMTAQAMSASAFTAPHVTEFITVDVTRTMKLVDRLREDREFRDVKVTPLLIVAKALLLAARRNPEINATWDEAAGEIVVKNYVNLGIAAATPRGLIVPNIKDADQMSLRQLADAMGALVATAREGRTPPADMAGGSITITNVGVFGVDNGTPILNPGEAAILCFGAVREMPWVVKGKVKPRWVTQLALSFDHRLVDGDLGSRFLADVAAVLEDPSKGLVWG